MWDSQVSEGPGSHLCLRTPVQESQVCEAPGSHLCARAWLGCDPSLLARHRMLRAHKQVCEQRGFILPSRRCVSVEHRMFSG